MPVRLYVGGRKGLKMANTIIIILFIIFIILDIITFGFLHNLIINFLKALPLFIIDIYKRDKGVFRGYGFWSFCGLGGSGKTLSIVRYLLRIQKKYPNVKVYTNFAYKNRDGDIKSWHDLLDTENINIYEITRKEYDKRSKWGQRHIYMCLTDDNQIIYKKKINDGVIFGFDEIHLTFESTKWQDAPGNLLDYVSQQRKLHKQILGSSQVFTRIDKKLREQTNYVIECKSIFGGRLVINSYYKTLEYIANGDKMDKGQRKRKVHRRISYVAYDNIRNSYNTEQIMKELSISRSKESVLIDLIKKVGSSDE